MFKMVWESSTPPADEAPEAIRLGPQHASRALELASLTRPGPFGPGTIELGEYFGCFEGQRLVAMAGERMFAGSLRELSGVCTHPDFQGRGLARRLVAKLIARQVARNETPFLHVMRENGIAHRFYSAWGFVIIWNRLFAWSRVPVDRVWSETFVVPATGESGRAHARTQTDV